MSSSTKVKPVPDGYPVVTPYLYLRDAAAGIEFYKAAFGATERTRLADPSGKVMHAELQLGAGLIMLTEECPQWGFRSPQALGGSPVTLHVYVQDVDALTEQARRAGATITREPQDAFYGDRAAIITDPFGHVWNFATHIEDVSLEEIQRRAQMMSPEGESVG